MKRLLEIIRNAGATCAILAATTPAFGNVIGTDFLNTDGTVTYSYVIDNASGSFDIAAWSLGLGVSTPDWIQMDTFSGGDVTVPNLKWIAEAGTPVDAQSAQDFLSLSPDGDIIRGEKLIGFSFTSRFLPGSVNYFEFSADGSSVSGQTIGPVAGAVPDNAGPIEAIALVGMIAFASRIRRPGGPPPIVCRS